MSREMKDSGVEWIGEIPKDWEISKIKRIARIYTGNSIKDNEKENYTNYENSIPYIPTKAIDVNNSVIDYNNGLYIPLDDINFKIAKKGSILVCIEGGSAGKKIAYLNQDVCFVNKLCCFESINFNNKYLYYYIKSPAFSNEFSLHISGLIGGVSQGEIKEFSIAIPSLLEQQKIANFLDEKVGEIDRLIDNAKKGIEEYKKYKQSVITETVTKGLDPNVEMKDSGIEWIGEIPKDWNIIKAKHKVNITNGSDPKTSGNIPVYGSGAFSFKTCGEYKEGPCVLIGRKGATLHIPHYIENRYWNVDTAFDVKTKKDDFELKYYYYLAMCFDYKYYISQTTLPSMTQTDYGNMYLPFPNKNTQQLIVEYLDLKCIQIEDLILKKEQLILGLESYKKSLIYEYVTGKRIVE